MSVEAPERIWLDVKAMSASSVAGRAPFFGVGYVRIDKLEELAAENEQQFQMLANQAQTIKVLQAALAEAKRENEALREALERIAAPAIFFLSRRDAIEMRDTARTALARNAGGKE